MKKSLVLLLLLTNILGYEPTTTPTLITFKLQSSEILSDSQGLNHESPNNSIKVIPKLFKKDSLIQDQIFELRQIDHNTFEVLGSPLSRAIQKK